jgi:ArsR family transcriptional regulator, virulence genes transcriptional regulator
MQQRQRRPDIFELHASVCRTLANPTRLKILALLGKKATNVGEMADTIGVSVPNISQHLALLKSHHLVVARKRGQSVSYSLVDRRIIQACAQIRSVLLDQMRMRGELAEGTDPRYVVTAE